MSYYYSLLKITNKHDPGLAGFVLVKSVQEELEVIQRADRSAMNAIPCIDNDHVIMDGNTFLTLYTSSTPNETITP